MAERGVLDEIRFSRDLSLWQVVTRGLGVMVMTAMFILLGDAVATAGSLAPLSFLLAALVVLVNSLGYIELAMSGSRPGGAYVQAHGTRGGWLAFLIGWILTVGW